MRLAIVLPAYNEEASIPEIGKTLVWSIFDWACRIIDPNSFVLFVDDGSTDNTWWELNKLARHHHDVCALKLKTNRGHQAALLAGLLHVKGICDAAITMDADGQHPPSAIPEFIAKFKEGADIVYGVRRRNPSLTSRLFYKLMGNSLIPNHGDYRLISARVLDTLTEDSEPFLRGLFMFGAKVGQAARFKTAIVEYDEQPRIAGRPSYTLWKRLVLFTNAVRWRFKNATTQAR